MHREFVVYTAKEVMSIQDSVFLIIYLTKQAKEQRNSSRCLSCTGKKQT